MQQLFILSLIKSYWNEHRKDVDAMRLYAQLTEDMPTNESSIQLIQRYSFYDLYWLLTTKVFGRYGQGSTRAEAELAKILMVEEVFRGFLPMDDSCLSFYQFGPKKMFIAINEMRRITQNNPQCLAAGHDRHVKRYGAHFNPFAKRYDDTFSRIICLKSKDWIKWNFNEYVGQVQQCLRSGKGTSGEKFAMEVFTDLLSEYPCYNTLVMTLVTELQWNGIQEAIINLGTQAKADGDTAII